MFSAPKTDLTKRLVKRFKGHPYSWDYNTKCMFLILDYTCRRARGDGGVFQDRIVKECGLALSPDSEPSNVLRASHISITKKLGISIQAEGNGPNRVYWYNHNAEQREVRQFMIQEGNLAKVAFLKNTLQEIPEHQLRVI